VLSRGPGPAAYAAGDRIEQLVRRHARLTPDAIAIRQDDQVLSYGDLVAMADRVAGGLQERGVGPGAVVPVCLPRSPELVGVLLGVLTTGAAYLAMDPGWPAGRREYVVTASGARFVIASEGHGLTSSALMTGAVAVPPRGLDGAGAACVFYTSGSTGRPKGVVSPHRGTVRILVGNDDLVLGAETVFLQAAPLPWDAFSLELWAPLLNGGCCVLLDAGAPLLDVAALRSAVERGVNTLWLTSSLFNVFVDEAVEVFASMRMVLVGGERVSVQHARRLLDHVPDLPLINGYGPVESTIFATTHPIRREDVGPSSVDVPIGLPVPGTGIVVVDEALRAVPPGVPGELLVSGDGLAHGYLGDPEQTARAFVEVDGVRHYRTGDVVVLDEGLLRYRGRRDRQLKVNGVRIEPGEVEAVLESHPGVRRCSVVLVTGDGRPRLVAVFESAGEVAPTDSQLRAFAAGRLLPAMIPAVLHRVDRLPLGTTGKVDVAGVLAMASAITSPGSTRQAPGDSAVLAEARSVLGVADIGLDDDLLAAGVTSIDVIRLTSRSAAVLGAPVGLVDVYRAGTLRRLVQLAGERASMPVAAAPVVAAAVDDVPLSPAQARFWLSEQLSPGAADNMVVLAYLVSGALDPGMLRRAFQDVVERHAVLRTVYVPVRRSAVARAVAAPLDFAVVSGGGVEDWWRQPFDLAGSPPFRVRVARLGDGRHLLGVHVHHIAFDGWSERILMAELSVAYRARAASTVPDFPNVPVHPPYGQAEVDESRLSYWRKVLEPAVAPAFAAPASDAVEGVRCEVVRTVPGALVSMLRAVASAYRAPAAAVLSAGVAAAVGRIFGVGEVCVGTVAPARPDPQFDGVVGCFVDPLPLALRDLADHAALSEAAEQLRAAMDGQLVPFDELVRALRPARGRHPWFQTWVVVQHEPPRGDLGAGVQYRPVRVPPPLTAMELLVEAVPREDEGWDLVASARVDGIGEAALGTLVEALTETLGRYAASVG
jgi:mycobactin peptide synthetase MbtE